MSLDPFKAIRRSVTFNVLKVVFSIYFVITFILTGLHMAGEFMNARQSVLHEMSQLSSILQGALAESLWTLDEEQIQSQIHGATLSKIVVGIRIIPVMGDQEWSYGKVADFPQFNIPKEKDGARKITESLNQNVMDQEVLAHSFVIKYKEANGHQTVLGLGIFFSDNSIVLNKVEAGFAIILINAIIKTIALWILVLWAGNRYITKPLGMLSHSVEAVDFKKLTEITVIKRDGNSYELEFLEDSFNRMIGNLVDLEREREKLLKDLDQSKNFLVDIINSMPSVLVVTDPHGMVIAWNSQAEHATKILSKEAIGKNIEAVLPQAKGCIRLIPETIAQGKALQKQMVIKEAHGKKSYHNLILFPLARSEAGIVVRLDDVTSQMELDSKITKTEKMMSLGGLAAGMAHEINNPINSVMLGVQNIVRRLEINRAKNEEVAKEVGVNLENVKAYFDKRGISEIITGMLSSGERASRIIYSMLQFSRNSGVKRELHDLNKIIDSAMNLVHMDLKLHEEIEKNNIAILRDIEDGMPKVPCAVSEIEQVFLNLVKNSVHALNEGYTGDVPNIWFRVYKHKKRDLAVIEVEDNGRGMTEATQRHVFEPFYTTKSTSTGSAGLGLSACYFIIVEAHGGSIEAESTANKGTKIIIYLPLDITREVHEIPKQLN